MEKTVEAYLRDQVRKTGGLALKLVCPGWTGVPDRLILLPGGRVFFAEHRSGGRNMCIADSGSWASPYLSRTARRLWTR